MGISFVAGSMLNSDLVRSTDLAFNTDLIYLDVGANRVGVNTSLPGAEFEVVGNILVGNIVIANVGNISAGNVNINNLVDPVANQDAATKYYVDSVSGNISNIANFNFIDTTITTTTANANIYIAPDGSGELIISSTSGFIVPVGNTAQQPGSPSQGTLRFNSESVQLEVFNGSQWVAATNEQSIITNQTITGDDSTVTFTLDQTTTADAILVTINGIAQTPTIDYSVAGNAITFTSTPITTDTIQVRFIASTTAISGVTLPTYTVTQAQALPSVSTGQMIYVSDGDSGNPCLAVYSGGSFKRLALGNTIST